MYENRSLFPVHHSTGSIPTISAFPTDPRPGPVVPRPKPRRRAFKLSNMSWSAALLIGMKFLKGSKLLFALLTLAAYSWLYTWQFACVFIFGLVCHEYGHVYAMRRSGIPTKGFYLIPFVGGICSPQRPFAHRGEEAYVAAMGPIFGLLSCIPCFGIGMLLTHSMGKSAGFVGMIAFLNLFNLLPIVPMDGGRILRSVISGYSRRAGLVMIGTGAVLAVVVAFWLHAFILLMIAVFACIELWSEQRDGAAMPRMKNLMAAGCVLTYLGLIAVATAIILGCASIEHGGAALSILQSL